MKFKKGDDTIWHYRKEGADCMLNIKQIFDMEDCDKSHEIAQLMSKLEKGEQSARENGWISSEDVKEKLGL